MSRFLFLVLMFINSYAMAAVEFPTNCQGIANVEQNWVIDSAKPSLYLINNQSEHDLWLIHTQKNPSASAGWTSQLSPGKWTAIMMDRKGFTFSCTESRPGHEQRVACSNAIAVCLQQAKLPSKNGGAYWVAENLPIKQLISAIQRRGIYPTI